MALTSHWSTSFKRETLCWIHGAENNIHHSFLFLRLFSWLHQENESLLLKSESLMLCFAWNLVRGASQKWVLLQRSLLWYSSRILKVLLSTQVWKRFGNSLLLTVTRDAKVFISFNRVVENSSEYTTRDKLSKLCVLLCIIHLSVNIILYLCCRS